MVMSGQVLVSWTACLRSFSAFIKISAALLRSASDIMTAATPPNAEDRLSIFGKARRAQSAAFYWQAARNSVVSTGQSAVAGGGPETHNDAVHFSAVRTSSGWPAL